MIGLRQNITVRADFLENGSIIPLAYIDKQSKTHRIDRVLKSQAVCLDMYKFVCRVNDRIIEIFFDTHIWFIEE